MLAGIFIIIVLAGFLVWGVSSYRNAGEGLDNQIAGVTVNASGNTWGGGSPAEGTDYSGDVTF